MRVLPPPAFWGNRLSVMRLHVGGQGRIRIDFAYHNWLYFIFYFIDVTDFQRANIVKKTLYNLFSVFQKYGCKCGRSTASQKHTKPHFAQRAKNATLRNAQKNVTLLPLRRCTEPVEVSLFRCQNHCRSCRFLLLTIL